jgi:hypothetical protein
MQGVLDRTLCDAVCQFKFCQKVAEEQNTRIVAGMIPPIIDPLNFAGKSEDKVKKIIDLKTGSFFKKNLKIYRSDGCH